MDLSIPYYQDNSRISNSAIGWFMKNGPSYLRKKLDGLIPDEKGSQLEKGTMIHEYILQPEEFIKDYAVFSGQRPKSDQQQRFCEAYLKSVEIEPNKRVLDAYKASYSIVGKSEDKMLSEGLKIASDLKDYMDAVKSNYTLISEYDMKKCEDVAYNVKQHKAASKLLNNPDWEEHHEFHINWEWSGIKCKSLLDCVKFDFTRKKCQLIDLKTTVKLWHFEDSIATYDYMRQLAFYSMAIYWYLKNERNEEPEFWSIDFYIVAIDSMKDSDVRVFKFTSEQVDARCYDIVTALKNIKWHQENNLWEHTREYYEGDGCETLDL